MEADRRVLAKVSMFFVVPASATGLIVLWMAQVDPIEDCFASKYCDCSYDCTVLDIHNAM